MAEALRSSKTPEQIKKEFESVQKAVGTQPLSRDAFIDPITGAERPINNPVTNPDNYSKDLASGQSNAVINKQIDAIAHDTTLSLAEKQQKMQALQATKTAPIGITPEMRQQIVAERDLPQNLRDMSLEQATANKLGISNPQGQDLADMYEMTYGSKLSQIIAQGEIYAGVFSAEKLAELGITGERMQKLIDMETDPQRKQNLANLFQQMQKTAEEGVQAAGVLGATPKPTNESMGVLSEALNAKNNFKQQKLGASDLFSMAGLSGYEVLAQSLNNRGNEMKQTLQSAASVISATGGAMASTYKAIADNYNQIRDDYDKQVERLLKIDADSRNYERQLEIMQKNFENDKAMDESKKKIIEDQRKADEEAMKDIYGDGGSIAGVKVDDSAWKKIFNIGAIGDWCGVFASKISTAPKVGNSWAEKRTKIQTRTNPTIGDKLLIPVGVKTDRGNARGEYGHVAVVVSYNPKTNTVVVVESNRDGRQNSGKGKGIITMGTYNLDKLKTQYGNDWGFAKGDLRKDYLNKVTKYLKEPPKKYAEVTPEMVKTVKQGLTDFAVNAPRNFANTLASLQPKKPTTIAGRYELATGKKLTDDVYKKLVAMTTQGRENFLLNLEKEALDKQKKEEEKKGITSTTSTTSVRW
jgi:hypothetical protein